MRKIVILSFFLFLFPIISPLKIFASFIKFDTTPVLSVGNSSSWDKLQVYGPSILFDNEEYRLWFTGNNGLHRQIGYANSKFPYNFSQTLTPIIFWDFVSSSNVGVEHPSVLKQNLYKMWFSNVENNISDFHLFYSTSVDGLSWLPPTALIFDSPIQAWESTGVGAPSVIFVNSTNSYHLWYVSRGQYTGSTRWRIGYATSTDGINWTKHPAPVIVAEKDWEGWDVANPCVLYDENTGLYEMFYHGDFGIGRATSTDGINWTKDPENPILRPTKDTFDAKRVFNPYVLKKDGIYYMWYTGINYNDQWQVGLATSAPIPSPPLFSPTPEPSSTPTQTPTPSPNPTNTPTTITPTSTPSPTLTPTLTPSPAPAQVSNSPVILIPGLGASWNPQDIFSCSIDKSGKWEIAPYVTIYNRLIKTLTDNAGFILNQNLYIYPYDWRQPLLKQALNFKKFIGQISAAKPAGTKFRLIGHSLGGLIIRSYLAENPADHHILSALTIGTPHLGTPYVYPIWEKGEITIPDMTLQIAIDQVINHCRIIRTFVPPKKYVPVLKLKRAKEVVQYLLPVIRQLLPVFDYLKQNGQIKETAKLVHQNDWISSHSVPADKYNIALSTLSGENNSTLKFIDVINPTIREKVFGEWLDGKPQSFEYTNAGDGTVLAQSSQIEEANNDKITASHSELVYSDAGIGKILSFLGISSTPIAPLIFMPEETSKNALAISASEDLSINISDPQDAKLTGRNNILVSYDAKAGLYRLELNSRKNIVSYLHVSRISKSEEPVDVNFALNLSASKPQKFYLIYNPQNPEPLNLIPL